MRRAIPPDLVRCVAAPWAVSPIGGIPGARRRAMQGAIHTAFDRASGAVFECGPAAVHGVVMPLCGARGDEESLPGKRRARALASECPPGGVCGGVQAGLRRAIGRGPRATTPVHAGRIAA